MNKQMNKRKQKTNGKKVKKDNAIAAPAALGVVRRNEAPQFLGKGINGITIKRREFVGTVANGAVVGYALHGLSAMTPGYDFNPGCSGLFPWLSNIAPCFERFRFRKLAFDVISAQSTSVQGRYYLSVDYDYDDDVAANKIQLMGNRTAAEAQMWQTLHLECLPQELHRDMPAKYVNNGRRSNFIEPRTSYCGFLMVAFDTTHTSLNLDLWVDYEVDLLDPINDYALVQDSIPSLALQPRAAITAAVGTGFMGDVPLTTPVTGALSVVVPGAPGVPAISTPAYGSSFSSDPGVARLLDLASVHGGKLDVVTKATETGVTPSAVLGNNWHTILNFYDKSGTLLGDMRAAAVKAAYVFGVQDPARLGVASDAVTTTVGLSIDYLRAAFPTVRYLMTLFYSGAAIGAGTAGTSFRYEV